MKGLALILVSVLCCSYGALARSAPSVWETTVDSATDAGGCSLSEAMQSMNVESSVGGCVLATSSATQPFSNLILVPSSIETHVTQAHDARNAFIEYTNVDPLTIRGVGGKALITRANSASQPFRFISVLQASLTLENLIFSKGNHSLPGMTTTPRGGAVSVIGGSLTIRNSDFLQNAATSVDSNSGAVGGAIFFNGVDGADVTIENTRFISNGARVNSSDNSASRLLSGGAITISNLFGNVTIIDSVFQANVAETDSSLNRGCSGGAINIASGKTGVVTSDLRPRVVIMRSAFANNTCYKEGSISTSTGGALRISRNLNVSILDSTLSGNRAKSGSAISGALGQVDLLITNSTIANNLGDFAAVNVAFTHAANELNSKFFITNSIIAGNLGADASLSSGKNIFLIYDNKTNFIPSHSVFGSSEAFTFSSHQATYKAAPDSPPIAYNFSQNDNLILTVDGDRPTALNGIIKPLQQSGTSRAHHALASGSPAIDAAVAFIDTFTISSPSGPQTVYIQGCRGTETVIQSAALPPPPFRDDQLRSSRFDGRACDIGAVEYRDELCFPILPSNGKGALVCL
ncbi:hypothetical protein [Arenicella xantha]|uniref:CSLREA domain-containing protein n=1 Tax=Arenicella xantha TaxID=644221 RepID=A0A395JKU0_9GAMM|nr:hypothetical protein [Arenicella xantha]RBP51045.1 hypothetical protein DFR28_102464 [Arenicella xantha]